METFGGFQTNAGQDYPTLENAGVPVNGVDEVQRLLGAVGISAGTFTVTFTNPITGAVRTTTPIAFNATAAVILAALRALDNFPDAGGAAAAGGPINSAVPVDITFANEFSGRDVVQMTVNNAALVGGVVTPSTVTPGVVGTKRGAGKGKLLVDTTNGTLYQNTGTPERPVWTGR